MLRQELTTNLLILKYIIGMQMENMMSIKLERLLSHSGCVYVC